MKRVLGFVLLISLLGFTGLFGSSMSIALHVDGAPDHPTGSVEAPDNESVKRRNHDMQDESDGSVTGGVTGPHLITTSVEVLSVDDDDRSFFGRVLDSVGGGGPSAGNDFTFSFPRDQAGQDQGLSMVRGDEVIVTFLNDLDVQTRSYWYVTSVRLKNE